MNTLNSMDSFFKRIESSAEHDPVRDWLVLITLSAIVLIGITVWNIWTFDTVANGGSIGGVPSGGAAPLFDHSSLDSIQALFTGRASEAAKYETGVYRYADPSQ